MLAKDNEFLQEAADSLYMANADEITRQKCRAREDAERHERTMKRDIRLLKKEVSTLKEEKQSLESQNAILEARIKELQAQLADTK